MPKSKLDRAAFSKDEVKAARAVDEGRRKYRLRQAKKQKDPGWRKHYEDRAKYVGLEYNKKKGDWEFNEPSKQSLSLIKKGRGKTKKSKRK